MSLRGKIRRSESPFWRAIKRSILAVLSWHMPVNALTRPIFRGLYQVHVFLRELVIWVPRFFWYEPLFRSRCVSVGERLRMELLPYITGDGPMVLGDRVRLSGKPSITFSGHGSEQGTLTVGNDTFIGHGCAFKVSASITIGDHCLIAGGVEMATHDGHPLAAADRLANSAIPEKSVRPIRIGNQVWIGGGAVILKGVTIGDRSIVGARAVVTKSVPADVVVAGNPAVIVKRLDSRAELDAELDNPTAAG